MEEQVEEAKISREVCGALCFKIEKTGTCLNVCESLIGLS